MRWIGSEGTQPIPMIWNAMPLPDSIASTTSFCGLWTVLSGCPGARNATVDNALGYVDLGDLDVTEVESALRTACDRLDAPELFGPDDVTLRDSARFTSKSTMMGSVPLRPAEIRMAWVLRNCERFVLAGSEVVPTWNKPFPSEPVNSLSAALVYLRSEVARWSAVFTDEPSLAHPARIITANEQWRVLENVRATLVWLHRRNELLPVPEPWACPRTRFNAGRCAAAFDLWLVEQLAASADQPGTSGSPELGPRCCVVVLRGPRERPLVRGTEVPQVTQTRYDILEALIEAGENGLSGRELKNRSRHSSAVNTLKSLARSSNAWGGAVVLPKKPGLGYRLGFE